MKQPIVLLTDFGETDPYVGVMKGVILSGAPESVIVDLTHGISPQDISEAAFVLSTSVRYFPEQTLFVAVVDPGVGSARRIVYVETGSAKFLAPDNGLLTLVLKETRPKKIFEVSNLKLFIHPVSRTFHGRDIFASVAGHLASGVNTESLGAPIPLEQLTLLDFPEPSRDRDGVWHGEIIYVDRFGNLVTNFRQPLVKLDPKAEVEVHLRGERLKGLAQTYEQGNGMPIVMVNSLDTVEIAVKNGNASQRLDAKKGERVTLRCLTSSS